MHFLWWLVLHSVIFWHETILRFSENAHMTFWYPIYQNERLRRNHDVPLKPSDFLSLVCITVALRDLDNCVCIYNGFGDWYVKRLAVTW